MARQKMSFTEACSKYVHRFTMEHVPQWAKKARSESEQPPIYYAPQYRSDREWYDATLFPPDNPLGPRETDCYTTNQTWPLGKWLDQPFHKQ